MHKQQRGTKLKICNLYIAALFLKKKEWMRHNCHLVCLFRQSECFLYSGQNQQTDFFRQQTASYVDNAITINIFGFSWIEPWSAKHAGKCILRILNFKTPFFNKYLNCEHAIFWLFSQLLLASELDGQIMLKNAIDVVCSLSKHSIFSSQTSSWFMPSKRQSINYFLVSLVCLTYFWNYWSPILQCWLVENSKIRHLYWIFFH